MESALKKISQLLKLSGISDKLDGRIKPTRHPVLLKLANSLRKYRKKGSIEYVTYDDEDVIVILNVEGMSYFNDGDLSIIPHPRGLQAIISTSELDSESIEKLAIDMAGLVERLAPKEKILLTIIAL